MLSATIDALLHRIRQANVQQLPLHDRTWAQSIVAFSGGVDSSLVVYLISLITESFEMVGMEETIKLRPSYRLRYRGQSRVRLYQTRRFTTVQMQMTEGIQHD
uniref:AlNc14C229G9269 protein n=1 Tax=Albugo laibachii Nc14 TaxID=890382 RepID=F0WSC9_9STRA|nr:AlNc14C229G9269 [Albugo laibachii Nc14]CCA25886.1 AlNc14C329G10673 [Albugo laibachii Nc14]|eukprot:CCA25886.1 AlNc14C329G10673 [Albugo laibachii Nc14]